jgi:hypothetical protein
LKGSTAGEPDPCHRDWICAGRSSRVAPVVSPKLRPKPTRWPKPRFPPLTEAVKALWRIPRPGPDNLLSDLRFISLCNTCDGLVKVALAEPALWSREAYLNDLLTRGLG